ncbi:MAG TPA: hypothetical protein VHX65_00260 [Pirellulales bacterium]|nr:hypothetical protein [Pirellulales bacterium]
MILALLGLDDETLAIAAAAARDPQHRIAVVCDLPQGAWTRLEAVGIRKIKEVPWESLLAGGQCDAVVVASPGQGTTADGDAEELRTEQLRKLVQEEVPLLVAHPVLNSVLACYEIDMIRRESGGMVLPYLPARFSPAIAQLRQLLRDPERSPIGQIEQLVFERTAKDRSRRAVLAHFARDIDLIRALVGDVTRVGVLGSPAWPPTPSPDSAYATLTVQMAGEGTGVIRWSILPPEDFQGGWLRIVGTKDRLELSPPGEGDSPLTAAEPASEDDSSTIENDEVFAPAAAALRRLTRAIHDREQPAEWIEAIRDIELSDAIPRSLVRGRTIEVQHEQPTEQGTFKGLMTSLGCGLLLIGLGAIVVLALLDAVANANHWQALAAILRPWPWVMCGVFGVFLMFQLLLWLTQRGESTDRHSDEQ